MQIVNKIQKESYKNILGKVRPLVPVSGYIILTIVECG